MDVEPGILKAARERLDKTQAVVAVEVGVTQAAVSHWEHGAVPDAKLWPAIAVAYGIQPKRLRKHFIRMLVGSTAA